MLSRSAQAKKNQRCHQSQFCSPDLGRTSEGPADHKTDLSGFNLTTVFPGSGSPAAAHRLLLRPSVRQVPFQAEQQKSVCLSPGSQDWKALPGKRIKEPIDLLPNGFLRPQLAVGSSLKPKGALCNLHQDTSLLWGPGPMPAEPAHPHTPAHLPDWALHKEMGRSPAAGLRHHAVSQQESPSRFGLRHQHHVTPHNP